MATRCFPHASPLLPEFMGNTRHYSYDATSRKCMCGEIFEKEHYNIAIRQCGDIHDLEQRDEWMRVRLGMPEKLPALSVKDTDEDVSARWYLITLTQPDTSDDPTQILKNTRKIIKSKMVDAITWSYCLELTQSGIPHTHIAVYTKKYPEYKKVGKFNCSDLGVQWRYDIQCEKHDIKQYIQKARTKPTLEFITKYNLEQFIFYAENYPVELKYNDMI